MADTIIGRITNTGGRPLLNMAQRLPSEIELFLRNNDNLSRTIRVAIPCEVVSFDASKQTIVAQPLIREKIIDRETGAIEWVALPQLVDVPVMFPQAGNFALTMPVQPGDEVTVLFADTCIDAWWQSGGIQNWMDRRRHDLSDGIAILGINSVPNVIENIASDAAELRTKDGTVAVTLSDDNSLTIKADGAQAEFKKNSVDLEGLPIPFDEINITANTSSIRFHKTIVMVEGVPVPIDTISINSPRLILNGVG